MAVMLTVFLAFSGGSAQADEPPTLIRHDDAYGLQYKIDVSEESNFWLNLRDAIRAGQTARVTHEISMKQADSFFGGTVARQKARKYVRYNLFENTYSYGDEPDNMRQTTQVKEVKNFLFSMDKPQFVPVNKLEKATLYDIQIRLKLDENRQGGDFLGISGLFGQKLNREFSYVAR